MENAQAASGSNPTRNPQNITGPSLTTQEGNLQGSTTTSNDTSKIPVTGSQLSLVPMTSANTTKTEVRKTNSGIALLGLPGFLLFIAVMVAVVIAVRARQRGAW